MQNNEPDEKYILKIITCEFNCTPSKALNRGIWV